MKLCVISTVAQHKFGADLHLKNLLWALEDMDVKILIQTYKSHGLKFEDPRVSVIEVDSDPSRFFFFWDNNSETIGRFAKDVDFFLFMEQDILFTDKPTINCSFPIQINLHSQYLSIFDDSRRLLYPRIWEGCTFIRSDVVRDALDAGVRFGSLKNVPKWIVDSVCDYYTTGSALHLDFTKISDHISRRSFLDTMFEFGLYCFINKIPYELKSEDLNYEYGDKVVHFRGCDMIVRDNPMVYENPEEMHRMSNNSQTWRRLINGCAFLFLVSGIYEAESSVARMIKNKFKKSDTLLCTKLLMMREKASEWLSEKEIESLDWAISMLRGPKLL